MFERKQMLTYRKEQLEKLLLDPSVQSDSAALQKYAIAYHDVSLLLQKIEQLAGLQKQIQSTDSLKSDQDPELREMVEIEVNHLREQETSLNSEIITMILPKDPADQRNVIMEIRAAAGGEESALFAAELFRMYAAYSEKKGWKIEILSSNPTDLGGYKELIFAVKGKNAYSRLKFEGGAHRVQRVPVTESSGRLHTSTTTVAVLPEAEEVDIEIQSEDLRIDVYRASGHGGQCVQKTDSAVRITHLPSGLVVTCQDERSQLQNKERAMTILRARLLDKARQAQSDTIVSNRRLQVKGGERSEKIRTYNFPQNRITDHRIGLDLYNLPQVMEGDLEELFQALQSQDIKERLEEESSKLSTS
jgi:peptide chain release factor 1